MLITKMQKQCTLHNESNGLTAFVGEKLNIWYTISSSICFGSTPKHTTDICRQQSIHVDSSNHYYNIGIIVFDNSYLGNVDLKQNKLLMYRPMRSRLILDAFYPKVKHLSTVKHPIPYGWISAFPITSGYPDSNTPS